MVGGGTWLRGSCKWQVRMDGSDGGTDLRMSIPENSACFVRLTAKQDGSLLLLGELLPFRKRNSTQYLSKDTVHIVYMLGT